MAQTFVGLFKNSKAAGNAVAELKEAGFTDDISVVAKDWDDAESKTHQVKQDVKDGATGGAVTGAVIGGLTALLGAASNIALPGIGPLLVGGPIATLLGGAAVGAAAGGIVGALVDLGIPENRAKEYESHIRNGDVLVAVTADDDDRLKILDIFRKHDAIQDNAAQFATP